MDTDTNYSLGFKFVASTVFLMQLVSPVAFAQEEATTDNASSTEEEELVEEKPRWFTTDRLSGNITQGDFVVGPGRTEINLAPGETHIEYISISNRISDNRIFKLEVEDITGTDDGSQAVTLVKDERGPYSILDYISFPETEFELELGERAKIPVTVTVPPDAEPGGYYGSVLVSTIQADGDGDEVQAARQPVIARIGSLFFLTVEGDTVISGETKSIDTVNSRFWYESGPIELGILYENTGSVHVNPYGELSITNMLGEEVGYVEIEPWFVLPNSLRVRELSWDREFLLGRYKVTANINRGYDDVVDQVSTTFWVLPWRIVGGTFLVIFIVLFVIRAFFRTFEFKRKEKD